MSRNVVVVDHPLIQHKLTIMRQPGCPTLQFRTLLREIGALMTFEMTRDLPLEEIDIETPLEPMKAPTLAGKKPVLVSILRAGVGMLDGALDVMPSARVGHVGMARDAKTLEAHEYYFKLPQNLDQRDVFLLDPMLATGNTAVAATGRVREEGPRSMRFMCLVAAPEGIKALHDAHPDIPIYTAAIDRQLNDKGYILPGLGDAGDRIYGTK